MRVPSTAVPTDQIVTNCDAGPGCGMLELLGIVALVVGVVLAIGAFLNFRGVEK